VRDPPDALNQVAQRHVERAPRPARVVREQVQGHQRLEVALARPDQAQVGALSGGCVAVIDHHQHPPGARTATEPEPLEQPRMSRLRVLAPDHDDLRAIADLAQGGCRGPAPCPRDAPGRDHRSQPVSQPHRRARVLDRGVLEAAHERTACAAQQLAGSP
jgi:hypothetical protein